MYGPESNFECGMMNAEQNAKSARGYPMACLATDNSQLATCASLIIQHSSIPHLSQCGTLPVSLWVISGSKCVTLGHQNRQKADYFTKNAAFIETQKNVRHLGH
jgi:hypothetical protein